MQRRPPTVNKEPMLMGKPNVFAEVDQQRFVRLVPTEVLYGQILNWHTEPLPKTLQQLLRLDHRHDL